MKAQAMWHRAALRRVASVVENIARVLMLMCGRSALSVAPKYSSLVPGSSIWGPEGEQHALRVACESRVADDVQRGNIGVASNLSMLRLGREVT